MFVIQAQNIAITRHQQQLFNIEQLVINPGDRIGLIGANGAGKTTLIDILTGSLTPDAGIVDRQTTPVVVHQLHDISTQSGGEQVKNAILTALRQQPEWLILDEPSANLDETNQQWLIDHLNRFKGTLLLISHDRTLLNAVTTTTWSLADHTLTTFAGNYDAFTANETAQRNNQAAAFRSYQQQKHKLEVAAIKRTERAAQITKPNPHNHSRNELQDMKSSLRRNQGKMTKAARVIKDHAEHLTPVAKPTEQPSVTLRAEQFATLGRHTPINIQHLALKAGKRTLANDVNFVLHTGDRVAITGPNQVGKTTLLRAVLANQNQAISVNPAVKFGYFAQNMSRLDLTATIWQNVTEHTRQDNAIVRTVLAEFGFKATALDIPAQNLSGGQRVKVSLVKVLLSDANVLILDEPTNYLDLPTLTALEQFLTTYPGTVLFVSHDETFVTHVATRVLKLSTHGLVDPNQVATKRITAAQRQAADEALLAQFRDL